MLTFVLTIAIILLLGLSDALVNDMGLRELLNGSTAILPRFAPHQLNMITTEQTMPLSRRATNADQVDYRVDSLFDYDQVFQRYVDEVNMYIVRHVDYTTRTYGYRVHMHPLGSHPGTLIENVTSQNVQRQWAFGIEYTVYP